MSNDTRTDTRDALAAKCRELVDRALQMRGRAAQEKRPEAYVPADEARAALLAAIDRLAALTEQPEPTEEARGAHERALRDSMAENLRLRRMLCAQRHGLEAYMDDGEAQWNGSHPGIDYLRDSLDSIDAAWLKHTAVIALQDSRRSALREARPDRQSDSCAAPQGVQAEPPTAAPFFPGRPGDWTKPIGLQFRAAPTHEQMLAGYAVACQFGVYERKAFDLAEAMFKAMNAAPAAPAQEGIPYVATLVFDNDARTVRGVIPDAAAASPAPAVQPADAVAELVEALKGVLAAWDRLYPSMPVLEAYEDCEFREMLAVRYLLAKYGQQGGQG